MAEMMAEMMEGMIGGIGVMIRILETRMILGTALCGLAGLLLFLAQDWIVNWDPKAYQNLQGEAFREPVRLKQQPWYPWGLAIFWGLPIVLGLIQGLGWLWRSLGG